MHEFSGNYDEQHSVKGGSIHVSMGSQLTVTSESIFHSFDILLTSSDGQFVGNSNNTPVAFDSSSIGVITNTSLQTNGVVTILNTVTQT